MAIPAILFLILAVIAVISFCTFRMCFYSPPGKHPTTDDPLKGAQYEEVSEHLHRISSIMRKFPFEAVTISADDGTPLFGRYYHMADGAPVEILFHGYRSCAFRDCSGGHALARKMGYNTLVVDQRAHGQSGGTVITFGVRERLDCLRWAQYTADRFGTETPIILSGLSMGAATVLMASELKLPDNVTCILADSPYSSPIAIIEKVCRDLHYPVALCRPFLHLGAAVFGLFRLGVCNAREAVRRTSIPILLIHGEADHFVPCAMTHEIKAAGSGRIEAYTFPGAGHGLSYITDPRRYERIVFQFLDSIPALKGSISPEFIAQLEI